MSAPNECIYMRKPTPKIPRFEIIWDGHFESPYKVVDIATRYVVKEFDSAVIGERIARQAARELIFQLNGAPKRCPECEGEGREPFGPGERPCMHCNGHGYQLFV